MYKSMYMTCQKVWLDRYVVVLISEVSANIEGLIVQFSLSLVGTHIDAVYHTSVVLGGIEYFFGQGIQTSQAGTTHHGNPMEVIDIGHTDLPMELILEYLESLKQIYTAESYDLFMKNCNNFSNDFSMFLVGKGIPDHITSLPQTVLNTPFGQILRPQLDSAMRSITQAPTPTPPAQMGTSSTASDIVTLTSGGSINKASQAKVINATTLQDVSLHLDAARSRCAVILFTSATCPPCKLVHPVYEDLAVEVGDKATLLKVDIDKAYELASEYGITATPTFITFLESQQENRWSGANPSQLRGNVSLLIQAALHPHTKLNVQSLLGVDLRPILFTKLPPLEKLKAKMGNVAEEPIIKSVLAFIAARDSSTNSVVTTVPDLSAFNIFLDESKNLPLENLFPLIDLLRLALVDPRISGFFAELGNFSTIARLLDRINSQSPCPYSLNLVALHMCCNLFSSPIFKRLILQDAVFSSLLVRLLSASFLDDSHSTIRSSAASLAFNIAAANHKLRKEERHQGLPNDETVELLASLFETLGTELIDADTIKQLVAVIGLLVYLAPQDGEIFDLCMAMDAEGLVKEKERITGADQVVKDVGRVLLAKGLSNH
ncbi:DUF862-domain-containing protein [Pseudovirgaria hyperparasitica]|uniref:DUF862-domain-containing protein n=1 Tax=Pseudovirgaria hyperparasitica TaxID=470096 RepID=A0A6A6WKP8_9PEZI|nr:DUF862-domain-containing protein [Pseudovirgaria hyperparasitica]KAF2762742.1 DUF862-domain-containing protein [Pseudovirgaria hyperparasitica]